MAGRGKDREFVRYRLCVCFFFNVFPLDCTGFLPFLCDFFLSSVQPFFHPIITKKPIAIQTDLAVAPQQNVADAEQKVTRSRALFSSRAQGGRF